jgi:hypothetical protein
VLALVLAAIAASTSPPSASWLGVSSGESLTTATTELGTPLLRQTFDDFTLTWFRTKTTGAFVFVRSAAGVVTGIGARTSDRVPQNTGISDPYGVSLGGSFDQLKTTSSPARLLSGQYTGPSYSILYYHVNNITWIINVDRTSKAIFSIEVRSGIQGPAPSPSPQTAATIAPDAPGASVATAYVVNARNEQEGVSLEYAALSLVPGCGDRWLMMKQSTLVAGDRPYDKLDLECDVDHDIQRSVFFDIASFYGKD